MAVKFFVVLRAYDTDAGEGYDALEAGPFETSTEAEVLREDFAGTAAKINAAKPKVRYTALLTQREV